MVKDTDIDLRVGHRERLRQKFLDGKLTEYELLELLISFVIPRRDVRLLTRKLMKKYGSMHQVLCTPVKDLESNEGIGHNTAVFLKVVREVMIAAYHSKLSKQPIFHEEKVLSNYCNMLLAGKQIEEFHVLYLDGNRQLLLDELHSSGTVNWSAVYTREIVKRALDLGARSVVLMHNHPTVCTGFSDPDIKVTADVSSALFPVGIELYDHFVVSGGLIYSMRSLNLLK